MGPHGRGGTKRLWLGSVAENVVRQAGAPVLVARKKLHEFIDPGNAHTTAQRATILCPVNFSEAARARLAHGASLAHQFNTRLSKLCRSSAWVATWIRAWCVVREWPSHVIQPFALIPP